MRPEKLDLNIPNLPQQTEISNGGTLKTFKLAMAADAEFTANNGETKAAAYAKVVYYVNNMNTVYKNELSVSFTLVSNDNLVYTDVGTDPYDNNDQSTMLTQNQTNLDNVIGNTNYDVGHVLGYVGGSGGGIAVTPSVCDATYKAQGTSGVGDGSFPQVFNFQLINHEVGHQFGMSHSYNSNVPVCTTRNYPTSIEPGAGTTIMSYGFTCDNTDPGQGLVGDDNYENPPYNPFLNFHIVSIQEALTYIGTLTCFSSANTGNSIPTINSMPTTYTIPKSTPFVLNGKAVDANTSDDLSYSWEGTNISNESNDNNLTATTISETDKPPFFRSYEPILTTGNTQPGLRYYPRLSAILDGTNYAKGDKLPSIAINTTHTLTVRDNKGGIVSKDVTVTIDGSGPFLISNDPTGTKNGYSHLTVTWSVNGTNAAPVNCTLVNIMLSRDGGLTFPDTLKKATSNDGTEDIQFPNINTSKARIKVAASNSTGSGNTPNIFFDISNSDFTINTIPTPVIWLAFGAQVKEGNDVNLTWKTANEINNTGFDIEMSEDAVNFHNMGFEAAHRNEAQIQKYTFDINNLNDGIYSFRLKQINKDASSNYSKIISVLIKNSQNKAFVYPNPTTDIIRINPGTLTGKTFNIRFINAQGDEVLSLPAKFYNSIFEISTSQLPSGIYQIILSDNTTQEKLKMIKI